ncbi:MAG: DUF5615 family PIN-like protein [candidate division Zixibacteria bacterium]|nr:DUF5615 family PIN-like protein [candidate division Zixibacteria bacterium]
MAALRIYADESVSVAIVIGLRQRGVEAWCARDAGNLGLSDEEQLEYACREKALLFTHDDDFLRIAHFRAQQGEDHWGIVFVHSKKFSPGECIRRLARYAITASAEEMKNRVEFL